MFYSTKNSSHVELYFTISSKIISFSTIIKQINFANYNIQYAFKIDEKLPFSSDFQYDKIEDEIIGLSNIVIKATILTQKADNLNHSIFKLSPIVNNIALLRPSKIKLLHDSKTLVRTRTGNLYNPYQFSGNEMQLQNIMSKSMSDIWGFNVIWFKVTHEQENAHATFREYDFGTSMQSQEVRIVIKNNFIPDNRTRFAEFDIDFQDELEIHIDKVEWAKVFGDLIPSSDDYFYLPLSEQMYVINAPYKERKFMRNGPFWKMICVKYEKRSSTLTDDFVDSEIDELIDFTDDYAHDQIKDEQDEALGEHIITPSFESKNISECYQSYNGNEIFRYYYNFDDDKNIISKKYEFNIKNHEFTVLMWIKVNKDTTSIFGMGGIKVTLEDKLLKLTAMTSNIVGEYSRRMGVEVNYNEWFAISLSSNRSSTILSLVDCNMMLLDDAEIEYPLLDDPLFLEINSRQSFANVRINKRKLLSTGPLSFKLKMIEKDAIAKENYIIDNAVPSITQPEQEKLT